MNDRMFSESGIFIFVKVDVVEWIFLSNVKLIFWKFTNSQAEYILSIRALSNMNPISIFIRNEFNGLILFWLLDVNVILQGSGFAFFLDFTEALHATSFLNEKLFKLRTWESLTFKILLTARFLAASITFRACFLRLSICSYFLLYLCSSVSPSSAFFTIFFSGSWWRISSSASMGLYWFFLMTAFYRFVSFFFGS